MEDNTNQVTETVDSDTCAQNQITEPVNEPTKTFTQEEVDQIIQKRLSKEKAKIKAEADEAARMAKMGEAERQKALFDKQVKDFEEQKKAFEEAQSALNKEKLLNETSKQLAAKNLPIDFAEQLISDTAENTLRNIDTFEQKWQVALDKALESKLKGSTPTSPLVKNTATKAPKDMSFSEFAEYQKNKND
ncbi:hypothetical protein TPELB_21220 [Terrisporobacter petrolearius]|uniref:DUF4355 domain-containing protein n=1 Tax=Terrisporobacter petrolearius TaxID=1460447 RepID=A0ABZ3FEI8_9FIRM